ncbi:MAG: hypothetical protein ACKVWV_00760 [Planctomycetota bacterium]
MTRVAVSGLVLSAACRAVATNPPSAAVAAHTDESTTHPALHELNIKAEELDGTRTVQPLVPGGGRQIVAANKVVRIRFDNQKLAEGFEHDVARTIRDVEEYYKALEREAASLNELERSVVTLGTRSDSTPLSENDLNTFAARDEERKSATKQAANLRLGGRTLRDLSHELPLMQVEVVARRTTSANEISQLVIPYWTTGEPERIEPQDLPSRIQRLVDSLRAKAKEAEQLSIANKQEGEKLNRLFEAERLRNALTSVQNLDGANKSTLNALTTSGLQIATSRDEQPDDQAGANLDARTQRAENIRRSLLGFLPDAHIDLSGSGVKRGDKLDVSVRVIQPSGGGGGSGPPASTNGTSPTGSDTDDEDDGDPTAEELVDALDFHLDVDDLGWTPHVRPQLILFRSTSGSSQEKEWKANAAGLIEWSYRYRDPHGFWKRFVNDWEPGLGIHVASIDQGDSAIEIGSGANVSFKQGLVSVGWGYNLSERDHYWFLGGDLFKLFDTIKGLAK